MSKIMIITCAVVGFCAMVIVFLFPGFYPLRPLEPIFISVCEKVMKGEINKVEETQFIGLGGVPVRKDYIECGVDSAVDANEICYIFEQGAYLGAAMADECYKCQYGEEKLEYKGKLLGKSCKPYRKVWRWNYGKF